MSGHGIGVQSGLPVLDPGTGGLGHESPQPEVLGFVGEMSELFVDDAQFLTQLPQPNTHLAQPPLHEPHAGSVRGRPDQRDDERSDRQSDGQSD